MKGKVAKIVKKSHNITVKRKPSFTLIPSYFFSKLTRYKKAPKAKVIANEYAKAEIFASL